MKDGAQEYFKQKQYIAEVNEKDEVVGKIEKWEAHQKGILHRGFTAIVSVGDQLLIQHRKHPVFDNVFDFSFSSHPVYTGNTLQSGEEAVIQSLKREWNVDEDMIVAKPRYLRKCKYKAFDDISGNYEHEYDHIYTVGIKEIPVINYDFAYGFFVLHKDQIAKLQDPRIQSLLAPWVNFMLEK